jgi:DNA-binding transcriptional LysR family regulator
MRQQDPDHLDLNLLRVLWAITQTRSVTRAGELLGMSQPAASRALARLRIALNDPLLVRTSKGYVLTPSAEVLALSVDKALRTAQQLFIPIKFDPAQAARKFRVASTDYGALAVVAPVTSAFTSAAPGCSIAMQLWDSGTLNALESGDIDLAFYSDATLPPDFHARNLFIDSYVALVRRDHPLSRRPRISKKNWLDSLAAYPQIAIRFPSGRTDGIDDILAQCGEQSHHLALTMPYFATSPWMLPESDLVLTLPRRVAEPLAKAIGLTVLPIPADGPAFTYRMIWHERSHRDDGVTWLRTLITSHIGTSGKGQARTWPN